MATTVGSSVPQFVGDITLDPSSIPAFSYQTETFAVSGVTPDMIYSVRAASLESGLVLLGSNCTTAGTLILTFWNPTSAAINPASQVFKVLGH